MPTSRKDIRKTGFFEKYKTHHRTILALGIPVVVGQLGQIALGWADNIMVGHYNAESLAASSFVNNLFNLPVIFGMGFSYGLTPIVSDLYGKRNDSGIGRFLKSSLFTNLLVTVALLILMAIVLLNVHRLGQPDELIPLIIPYFCVQLVSLVFIMGFNSFKQFSEGIMNTYMPMWVMLGCNVLNIVGNYLLIYGRGGFPEMGLLGAGISTVAARVMMLAVIALIFFRGRRYQSYQSGFRESWLNKGCIKKLTQNGIFIGMQMGFENGAFSLIAIMVGWVGTTALAAHQVVGTVTTIGYLVYYGIGAAVAIRISHYAGQKDWTNTRLAAAAGFHVMMAFVLAASVFLFFIRNSIAWLFVEDAGVAGLVALLMLPVIVFQFGDGLQVCYANVLRGFQDVKAMAVIAFIGHFVVMLSCCYFLGFVLGYGVVGIWSGIPFGLTFTGLLFYLRYRWVCKQRPAIDIEDSAKKASIRLASTSGRFL